MIEMTKPASVKATVFKSLVKLPFDLPRLCISFLAPILTIISVLCVPAVSQELPGKIRGYKVHNEIVKISNNESADSERPSLIVREIKLDDIGLTGITMSVTGEANAAGETGQVERLMFHDFQVNGIPVKVEEIEVPFTLNKAGPTILPRPLKIFIPTQNLLKASWSELNDPKKEWTVTGRVFVFGKFKKFGLSFRRAIPVDVNLIIANPLSGSDKVR